MVFIPAFNEEKTIASVIKKLKENLSDKDQIIVIDDFSSDKTADISKKSGAEVVRMDKKYGLAKVYNTGIKKALEYNPEFIVSIDADGQYEPSEISKLLEPLEEGVADLVLGSRFLGSIEEMTKIKYIGNRFFSMMVSFFIGQKIYDAQTGFRAFSREFGENIEIKSLYTYTQEMIILAKNRKLKIKEVPIKFYRRKHGESKLIKNPAEYLIKGGINLILTVLRSSKER